VSDGSDLCAADRAIGEHAELTGLGTCASYRMQSQRRVVLGVSGRGAFVGVEAVVELGCIGKAQDCRYPSFGRRLNRYVTSYAQRNQSPAISPRDARYSSRSFVKQYTD
jgi:hypothetical protein